MPPIHESLSPAKVNLALAVIGKRADGYHELITLMACVDLYDHIQFDFQSPAISIRCRAPGVPADDANLACRAAVSFRNALMRKTAIKSFGLRMVLTKRIPVGAGLGGGSSNAATVLKVLNRRFDHPFTPEELASLALPLGADIPYFLYGQPAIVAGIGEKIQPYRGLRPAALLIVFPGIGLSTAKVYKALNLRLTKCEKKLRNLLLKKEAFEAGVHLCNDLESPAIQMFPDIMAIKAALSEQGAEGAIMSGSGSAVVGLFKNAQAAQQAREGLSTHDQWQVFQGRLLV